MSDLRKNICVDPVSRHICPEKEDVVKESAVLVTDLCEQKTACSQLSTIDAAHTTWSISGQLCLDKGSRHTLLRISDTYNLHAILSATPIHVQLPNGSLISSTPAGHLDNFFIVHSLHVHTHLTTSISTCHCLTQSRLQSDFVHYQQQLLSQLSRMKR